jgi:hypothetical protein
LPGGFTVYDAAAAGEPPATAPEAVVNPSTVTSVRRRTDTTAGDDQRRSRCLGTFFKVVVLYADIR